MIDYGLLTAQAVELTRDMPYLTANLANLAALLFDSLENINWAGFYELKDDKLVLAPFQGRPACVVLPKAKGVCWKAVAENKAVNVPDVHAFPGHIACDSASRSEIVLPLHGRNGDVRFVLDIDSPIPERFDSRDEEGLKRLADAIESSLFQNE